MAKKKVLKPHVIRVKARQTVHYDQTLYLTDEEWKTWQEKMAGDQGEFGSYVQDWLNLSDVCDGDDIDGDDVDVEEIKE